MNSWTQHNKSWQREIGVFRLTVYPNDLQGGQYYFTFASRPAMGGYQTKEEAMDAAMAFTRQALKEALQSLGEI